MLRTRSPRKEKISNCYLHSNSLSNKMDNSLLAVRDINHKYIVVEMRSKMADLNELNEKVEQIKADIREQLEKIENTKGVYEYKKPFSTRTVLSAV